MFAGDLFLRFQSQDDFTLFPYLAAWMIGWLGLEHGAAVLTFTFLAGWLLVSWHLARALAGPDYAWLAIGLPLVRPGWYGAGMVFRTAEPFLSARPAAESLRRTLREAGVRGVARGVRESTRSNPCGLTAAEMKVLQFMGQDLRNAEIAARLDRSVRTVDHHVAAILAKLGVESRQEAVRLVGRRRLTLEESSKILVQLEDDVAAGRLLQVPVDLYAVFSAADALSAWHAARILSRSLDTLHVAAALELGCSRFVTFDTRQGRLAAARGLKVADLTRTRRRARRR